MKTFLKGDDGVSFRNFAPPVAVSEAADFRSRLVDYIQREAQPVDKFSHQPRLYSLATQIGSGQSFDDDVLFAAAWIHDLGVFSGHRPSDIEQLAQWNNTIYAMERAPAILACLGFPPAKIDAVVEAVRTHQPSGDPQSVEAVLLRDADILEQLGAVGILRMVSKIGRDTRFPTFGPAIDALRRSRDQLPDQLRLERSRQMAKPKIAILTAFLAAADQESEGTF